MSPTVVADHSGSAYTFDGIIPTKKISIAFASLRGMIGQGSITCNGQKITTPKDISKMQTKLKQGSQVWCEMEGRYEGKTVKSEVSFYPKEENDGVYRVSSEGEDSYYAIFTDRSPISLGVFKAAAESPKIVVNGEDSKINVALTRKLGISGDWESQVIFDDDGS